MRQLQLIWEFYKSLFMINFLVIVIALVFNPDLLFVNLCLIAIPIQFAFKEFYRQKEYYFYFNNAISKLKLFGYCFAFNFILFLLIRFAYALFS